MSASEIKAGGAYVEISARLGKLAAGLSVGEKMVRAFSARGGEMLGSLAAAGANVANKMAGIGQKLMAGGAAALAPLILAGKTLGDYGENIGKLASKTGMSSEVLAGLAYQAESAGISISAIGSAVKTMQRNLVNGSKDGKAALKSLGISAEQLKGMSPDQQFATLADAIAGVEDSSQRASMAQTLFGRAGVELLPIVEGGAAEMARARREADALGLVLGKDATESANKLDSTLDRLGGGLKGLQLQLGAAIAPLLVTVAQKLLDVVTGATMWVKANPEAVQGFAKMAAACFTLGAGLFVVGAGVATLLSPVAMISILVAGLGSTLLAVLDIAGITDTGFGELFNSIRVNGTGLGTWFAAFGNFVAGVWLHIEQMARDAWGGVKLVGELALRSLYQAILLFARVAVTPFETLFDVILFGFNNMIAAFNKMAKYFGANPIDFEFKNPVTPLREGIDKRMGDNFDNGLNSMNAAVDGSDARAREYDDRRNFLEKERQKLFAKDPQDGTKGLSIDTGRARAALEKIGGNVIGALDGAFDGLMSKLNIPAMKFEEPAPIDAQTMVPVGTDGKTDLTSTGTFSGLVGDRVAGSGVLDAQLRVQQDMAAALRSIDQKISPDGGGLG